MMTRHMHSPLAVRAVDLTQKLFAWACLVLLASCARNAMPSVPSAANNARSLMPNAVQLGTPPVHWMIYGDVTNLLDGEPAITSSPLAWHDVRGPAMVVGVACCITNNEPGQTGVGEFRMEAQLSDPEPVALDIFFYTQGHDLTRPVTRPVKLFKCDSGSQICIRGDTDVLGASNIDYVDQPIMDATSEPGKAIWYTTCCNGSYIVHAANGARHWYRIPERSDRLSNVAFTSDAKVWVTLQKHATGRWVLAKLNPATSLVTEYPLQLQSSPVQLLVGPDGNVWFAMGATLYRVNRSTALLTRFPLPKVANGYLTGGPGSTLWLAYGGTTTDQGLIETNINGAALGIFRCPVSVCFRERTNQVAIRELTTGPDENIWFAYSSTNVGDPLGGGELNVFIRHAITVTPTSLNFSKVGESHILTVSEENFSGPWTAKSNMDFVRVVRWIDRNHVQIQLAQMPPPGNQGMLVFISDPLHNFFDVDVTVGSQSKSAFGAFPNR